MKSRFLISGALTLWAALAAIGAIDMLGRAIAPSTPFGEGVASAALIESSPSPISGTEAFEPLAEPLVPARLIVPKLGIDAAVEPVGLNIKGNMTVPSSYETTSWYRPGSKAGQAGNAVIAGHLDNSLGLPGVFEHLNQLNLGDTVSVKDKDGSALLYKVTSMAVYPVEEAPVGQIFRTDGPSQLVLITCNGAWDQGKRSYDKRLVVIARPVTR